MRHTISTFCVVAVLAFSLSLLSTWTVQAGVHRQLDAVGEGIPLKGPKQGRLEGRIVGINLAAKQVSIRRLNGTVVVVQVLPGTKIERNDLHATLASFKVGDRGQARFVGTACVKLEATGA